MKILSADSGLKESVRALSEGRVLAYPTETFYGFGVDAGSSTALSTLAHLKGRDSRAPFPLLLPSKESLQDHVDEVPPAAQRLIDNYWPGPLTLVLRASGFDPILRGPSGGVGFRVSAHPLATAVVRTFGRCITATSANPTGGTPARCAADIQAHFESDPITLLDGGSTLGLTPSTVIDFTDPVKPRLLRAGAISWTDLQKFLT